MSRSSALAATGGRRADRLARAAERLLWLPRRRMTVRQVDGALRLLLRGEHFDRPDSDLEALRRRLAMALDRKRR